MVNRLMLCRLGSVITRNIFLYDAVTMHAKIAKNTSGPLFLWSKSITKAFWK